MNRQDVINIVNDVLRSPATRQSYVANGIPVRAVDIPLVTSLPLVPRDSDEVYFLADADSGVVWHLRYRADAPSLSYRWEFVGGHALFAETTTSETTTSTSYANLSGGATGPSLTLPGAGDYRIAFGCFSTGTTATALQFMSIDLNGAGAADADGIKLQPPNVSYYASGQSMRTIEREADEPGFTLTSKYKTNAGTATFETRWLAATPIRIGRV
jgi:hypothetical protein